MADSDHFSNRKSFQLGENIEFSDLKETKGLFKLNVIEANGTLFDHVTDIEQTINKRSLQVKNSPIILALALENTIRATHALLILYLDKSSENVPCHSSSEEAKKIISQRSCPIFKLSSDEFHWKTSMHGLDMENPQLSLDLSEYTYFNGNYANSTDILVCVDTYTKKVVAFKYTQIVSRTDAGFFHICYIHFCLDYIITHFHRNILLFRRIVDTSG